MLCPYCAADIPAGSQTCPSCGQNLAPGKKDEDSYYVSELSADESSYEKDPGEPLGEIDAVMRPYKDPDAARKMLIGGLVSGIPIVGQIVLVGYQVEYIRRIIFRENFWTLPCWDEWEKYLKNGAMFFLANVIYAIVLGSISVAAMIPFWGTVILTAKKFENSDSPFVVCGALTALLIPISIILVFALILGALLPMLQMLYSRKLQFGDAFKLGAAVRLITTDFGGYVVASLIATGLGIIFALAMQIIGLIAVIPILGWLVAMVAGLVGSFALSLSVVSIFAEYYYRNHKAAGV